MCSLAASLWILAKPARRETGLLTAVDSLAPERAAHTRTARQAALAQ